MQVIPTRQLCALWNRIIFIQDGTPPHVAKPEMQLLLNNSEMIELLADLFLTDCHLKSPDLNPWKFSL